MWKYTVQDDVSGPGRWWLWNASNDVMARSGESFDSTANATRAALNFKEHAPQWRYESFQGADGQWYWHAQAGNNAIVAAGGRAFGSRADTDAASNAVRVNGGAASSP